MPVQMRSSANRHFAITGTPTDCVLLAIYEIMSEKPTMLLSGINRGANLGEDITYSGTAAAAREGTLIGIPSVALSQVFTPRATVPWEPAETNTTIVLSALLDATLEPNCLFILYTP